MRNEVDGKLQRLVGQANKKVGECGSEIVVALRPGKDGQESSGEGIPAQCHQFLVWIIMTGIPQQSSESPCLNE